MAANPPLPDWDHCVAWIVGASSGIGRAAASALHAAGATVAVTARSVEGLQEFAARHPGSLALPADVLDAAGLAAACEQVRALRGRIDLVVYSAGRYQAMDVRSFDLAEAHRHVEVNYLGALNLLDCVLPTLRAQGKGHLSLVASVAGYRGLPRALAYGPTKAALQHLAEILYLDLQPQGIGVSVVNPGFVDTPMTAVNRFRMPALITPEEAAAYMLRGWASGRFDIHFPKRFTLWLKLLRLLPHGPYAWAVKRSTGQ